MKIDWFIDRMKSGKIVIANSSEHECMTMLSEEARKITMKINNKYHTPKKIRWLFSELIGKNVDEGFGLFPPFYTDCGKNITLGKRVFINACCNFQDQGGIIIGDDCLIGHNTVLATLNHGIMPKERHDLLPKPIRIGNNVWIGSHATILPGITIGDNAVVAAGAVVTKDVVANTVVGGVPAKVLKEF